MPRNPANKRLEVLLSPEQYQALKEITQFEYTGDMDTEPTSSEMAELVRGALRQLWPIFKEAKPIQRRGKYQRK
jgi:hypothetical protein